MKKNNNPIAVGGRRPIHDIAVLIAIISLMSLYAVCPILMTAQPVDGTYLLTMYLRNWLGLAPMMLLASCHRWVMALVTMVIMLGLSLIHYFHLQFQVPINATTIGAWWETDYAEASDFFTLPLLLWLSLGLIGGYGLQGYSRPIRLHWLGMGVLAGLIAAMTLVDGMRMNAQVFPYHVAMASWDCCGPMAAREEERLSPVQAPVYPMPLTIVLVIGESLRADHLSLNGYERETTPLMAREASLISLKQVRSCSAGTRQAMHCLMSPSARLDGRNTLVQALNQAGFETVWMGSQGSNAFNRSYLKYGQAAHQHLFLADRSLGSHYYDDALLPYYRETLSHRNGNKAIILHTLGSHWHYAKRYRAEQALFTPECTGDRSECTRESIINSYDNSIYATDQLLHALIEPLRDSMALLVYISDHGESLGEEGYYLHGNPARAEQRHIPWLMWISHKLQQHDPAMLPALRLHETQPLEQTQFFHSLLDCVGITSPAIDRRQSLCYMP